LASEWAGFETVLQVENDPYALRVLEKHWPDVPRITDVREVTSESVNGAVTVLSGGFPCQPFSTAARGRNNAADLWPEMLRVVEGAIPRWVIGENVQRAPIAKAARELEMAGYRAAIYVLEAGCFGAPHRRPRWFVVANSDSKSKSLSALDAKMASLQAFPGLDRWPEPPGNMGMDDGIPSRMDRLRVLGNAVVPQQAYPIFAAIAEVENENA
jgi:DNA (cytosine-5)-methyltransferase 1